MEEVHSGGRKGVWGRNLHESFFKTTPFMLAINVTDSGTRKEMKIWGIFYFL